MGRQQQNGVLSARDAHLFVKCGSRELAAPVTLDHHGSQPMEPSQAVSRPSAARLGSPRLASARPGPAWLGPTALGRMTWFSVHPTLVF